MTSVKSVPGKKGNTSNFFTNLNQKIEKPLYSLLSIAIGFFFAFIIILIIGGNPLLYISNIFKGNFYSLESFGNFLATLSWMILIGLSVSVSFKAGLFNIGVAGQMMAGGISGFLFAYYAHIGRVGVIFSILVPLLTGMFIAWFIGMLKVKLGVNEVLSSIMINWIIYWVYRFFTNPSYFKFVDTSTGSTVPINPDNSLQFDWLTNIFGPHSFINIGIIIALFVLGLIVFFYVFTNWGRKQNILGTNPKVAKSIGMKSDREIMKTMALSGALAGLAGSVYYLGIKEALPAIGSDIPGEGFNGITISLIAFNNPAGILFSSIFVSMLYNSNLMVSSVLNPKISTLILGIIILIISFSQFLIIYKPIDKIVDKFTRKKVIESPKIIDQTIIKKNNLEAETTTEIEVFKKSIPKTIDQTIVKENNLEAETTTEIEIFKESIHNKNKEIFSENYKDNLNENDVYKIKKELIKEEMKKLPIKDNNVLLENKNSNNYHSEKLHEKDVEISLEKSFDILIKSLKEEQEKSHEKIKKSLREDL